ncbi:MAG TPA: helix-turn-helix domain-containing protein [Ktedonobacteraceae bacterium]|nr:helix-turn-helix domain-containing protein [Ktedonobacteraceae bacterium]
MALQMDDTKLVAQYIRPKTIADKLEVSVDTVLRMVREGKLEGVRFEGQIRILYSSFQAYMETHKIKSQETQAHGEH